MDSYGIIYRARNIVNDKVYIGQTIGTLKARRTAHEKTKTQGYFQKSLHKYGFDKFNWSILYYAQDKESLNEAEAYWIQRLDSMNFNKGYNLTSGGVNGSLNKAAREKRSIVYQNTIDKSTSKKPYGLVDVTKWKPIITVTSEDKEHQIVTKARHAYRRAGDYTKSLAITKAVWNSGSYDSENIMLAIKAVRRFVKVEFEK